MLKELRTQLDAKKVSAVELTEQYLKRIEETNSMLNSFITVTTEEARAQAKVAQKQIDQGVQDPLTGIPYAAKDLFCTKGIRTTAASRILEHYIPPYSATAITDSKEAVLLGKTNLDEFAMGASTEYSAFGVTKNPFDLERVAGGSSGGSAAAVAAGQAAFAFGTDTGGSIRQPASFCNVVGFKPTYGRISRYGVVAMSSSLDTVGFFTKTVEDSAYLLNTLAGSNTFDTTTPEVKVEDYVAATERELKGLKIGIPTEYMQAEGLDPQIKVAYEELIAKLEKEGAKIQEVSLPHTNYALATYYVLCPAEVSSNMGRYDGIRYGIPSEHAHTLDEVFTKTRDEQIGREVKRRVLIGTFCLSAGSYDAFYKKAQQVRTLVTRDFTNAFQSVDVLLTPTSPFLPFKIGERSADPVAMYLADLFTVPVSLAGVPAVSLPCSVVNGLPVGMQLIAAQFQESILLRAAAGLERITSAPAPKLVV